MECCKHLNPWICTPNFFGGFPRLLLCIIGNISLSVTLKNSVDTLLEKSPRWWLCWNMYYSCKMWIFFCSCFPCLQKQWLRFYISLVISFALLISIFSNGCLIVVIQFCFHYYHYLQLIGADHLTWKGIRKKYINSSNFVFSWSNSRIFFPVCWLQYSCVNLQNLVFVCVTCHLQSFIDTPK